MTLTSTRATARGGPFANARTGSWQGALSRAVPARLALPLLIGAAAGVITIPVALAATSSYVLALGAAVAVILAVLMVCDPLIAVLVYAGLEVSQTGAVFERLGAPSPLVVTQVLTVAALAGAVLQRRLRVVGSPILLAGLVLLATRYTTLFTTTDPALTRSTELSETRDMAVLFCVLTLLWMTRRAATLVRLCVIILAALSALSGVQEYLLHNSTEILGFSQINPPDVGSTSFRHLGPVGDPNFWGRVLIMFLPFGPALALSAATAARRWGWWLATAALLLGTFLTQSRGAYLAAGAALVVFLVAAGWRYARWLALTPLVIALLLVLPGTGSRLGTLADLSQASSGGGDLSLVLRLATQEAGLRMFETHVLTGVGAGTYTELTPQYERGLTFATAGELAQPLAPHNAYLEFAAEGGLIGLLGLLTFLGAVLFCGVRAVMGAASALSRSVTNPERLLASAGVAAISGWCVASAFLHVRQFRTLLVLAAVVACLDATRTRRRPAPMPAAAAERRRRRMQRQRLIGRRPGLAWGVLGALTVVTLAGVGLVTGLHRYTWRAETSVVAIARPSSSSGLDAYHYDLLTRGQLVPTFAAALDAAESAGGSSPGAVRVAARTSARSTSILLDVQSSDRAAVLARMRQVPAESVSLINGLGLPFELRAVPTDSATLVRTSRPSPPLVLASALLGLLGCGLGWYQLQANHHDAVADPTPA